jgi:hypothetical protein
MARTSTVCDPRARFEYVFGLEQEPKSAGAWLSRRHSNVEPASLEEKANVALVLVVVATGPESIDVSGGVVSAGASIVQLQLAGVGSMLPAWSIARTSKVCEPSLSPV